MSIGSARIATGLARYTGRWVGAAIRRTVRARARTIFRRALAYTSCPPLVTHDSRHGVRVVDPNYTKSKRKAPLTAYPIWPPRTEQADPKRVKFWTKEADKDIIEPGQLCLSSHPLKETITEEDRHAIVEAILHGKIHTLGLPKQISISESEQLLRVAAFLNQGTLLGIDCSARKRRGLDESETYDLSRQTFDLEVLIDKLSQRKDLSSVTIYNIPLTTENITRLAQFLHEHAEPLVFYLNLAPSVQYNMLYRSTQWLLEPPDVKFAGL